MGARAHGYCRMPEDSTVIKAATTRRVVRSLPGPAAGLTLLYAEDPAFYQGVRVLARQHGRLKEAREATV